MYRRITDREDIEQGVGLLNEAKPSSPNHPSTEWQCMLGLDFGDRIRYCEISWVDDQANGLLIYVYSRETSGWMLGEFRQDRLRGALERLAGASATDPEDR
jgi:hypothetical protein